MKKKVYFLSAFLLAILFVSIIGCKKEEKTLSAQGEVSFQVNSVLEQSGTGGKMPADDTIHCSQLPADYVKYKINSGPFRVIPVFYISDIPWTNSIPLDEGTYTLDEFLVYSDNNTPYDSTDDVLLSATPHSGAAFADYVTTPLQQTFEVTTDQKKEVKLDVVCFEQQFFQNFGFVYFQLNELKVREIKIFLDFCIKNKADYIGSLYTQQTNWNNTSGPFIDVPAIIKVEVWRNGILQNTFQNSPQGEKLSVTYGDYTQQTDNFEIKLFVYVRKRHSVRV